MQSDQGYSFAVLLQKQLIRENIHHIYSNICHVGGGGGVGGGCGGGGGALQIIAAKMTVWSKKKYIYILMANKLNFTCA